MSDATQTPRARPPAFVKLFRYLLYLLLLGSAVATIAGVPTLEEAVREGRRPPAFLLFLTAIVLQEKKKKVYLAEKIFAHPEQKYVLPDLRRAVADRA